VKEHRGQERCGGGYGAAGRQGREQPRGDHGERFDERIVRRAPERQFINEDEDIQRDQDDGDDR
jgi:hypothetical protein